MKERRLRLLILVLVLVFVSYGFRWFLESELEEFSPDSDLGIARFQPAPSRQILPAADPEKMVEEGPPSLATLFEDNSASVSAQHSVQHQSVTNVFIAAGVIALVWIPEGVFVLGSPDDEEGHQPSEGPLTKVTISRGYWLSRYELTIGQCRAVLRRVGVDIPPAPRRESRKPVVNISWEDAANFCARLNELEKERLPEGYVFRLPTEAEWEYACRAGATGRFNLGDFSQSEMIVPNVWCSSTSGGLLQDVGRKPANSWGLHDMHGNAAEWVMDVFSPYPGADVTDPLGAIDGEHKIRRGGSFRQSINECRSAARVSSQGIAEFECGFRIALAPPLLLDIRMDMSGESTQ